MQPPTLRAPLDDGVQHAEDEALVGKRAQRRAETEAEILRVAREHLAHQGAAALSLRAIARDLGMVSSGIYRYVDSRDELLTRLIIDSYSSLAGQVDAGLERQDAATADAATAGADGPGEHDRDSLVARWEAIGLAVRDWALTHPHDFALLYGSPVPDYAAPADRTVEAGTAVLARLLRLLQDAHEAGRLVGSLVPGPMAADPEAALGPLLSEEFFAGATVDAAALGRGLSAWTLLLGAVTSEVFEQLGPVPDAAALFRMHLATAAALFLTPAAAPGEPGRTAGATDGR